MRLTGSDRLTVGLSGVLTRGGAVVATTGPPRTLRGGAGTLRLRPVRAARLVRGRYRLTVTGRQERRVVVRRSRTLVVG